MEVLRVGSKGDAVKSLQLLLKQEGYTLIADGIFGTKTEDIVIDYQKQNHLTADGVVGKSTWASLLSKTNPDEKRINDTAYVLPEKNYYKELHLKKNIVLHHTNGWTVVKGTKDKPSMNHIAWWKSKDEHVATAFSIDYKGNIYQHFDPKYWSYHIGLGSARNYLDKKSIAIEITNEGFLDKKDDGSFVWFSGEVELPYNRPQDEPIYVKEGWRGYHWFAPYSKEQVDATLWLVNYLCKTYNIKKNFIDDCDYHEEILTGAFEGIYNHANVRVYPSKRNKWDLSPAFPYQDFKKRLHV